MVESIKALLKLHSSLYHSYFLSLCVCFAFSPIFFEHHHVVDLVLQAIMGDKDSRLRTPPKFTPINISNSQISLHSNLQDQTPSRSISPMPRKLRVRKAPVDDHGEEHVNAKRRNAASTFVPVFSQSSNASSAEVSRSSTTPSQQSSSALTSPLPDVFNGSSESKTSIHHIPSSSAADDDDKPKPSSSSPVETKIDAKLEFPAIPFETPSSSWFKKACQKLGLEYDLNRQTAIRLWSKMEENIKTISSKSIPVSEEFIARGEGSGFRAIAYLISGTESSKIKQQIGIYFLNNYKSLGNCLGKDFSTMSDAEAQKLAFSEYLIPEFCEIISKWLGCRIGVFHGDTLFQYGDWSGYDDMATLLLKLDKENYQVVTSLYEKQ